MVRSVTAALYPGLLAFGCAVLMDARVRLPSALHPVAWFGRCAQALIARAPLSGAWRAGVSGVLLALVLPCAAALLAFGALDLAARAHAFVLIALQVLLFYSCVCLYGLLDAARRLDAALRADQLELARERLTWLCSRDPSQLDERALCNGTIESLAENLSDSVVAPLLFLVCFGLPGAVAYRAINTLDAMIGYRGRYEWLGKASARLDDLVNYVPARLTALLLAAAGLGFGRQALRRGAHTWLRDRARTQSPNAGHPMAMAAGLLGVRLDKPGQYVLGPELRAPARADLHRSLQLCQRAGQLALLLAAAALGVRGGLFG